MEVAPFFVDFHHFLSIFTIFYRFSRFKHFCRDLHFVAIHALFPQIFFGQSSLLRNITRFLHVCVHFIGCLISCARKFLRVNLSAVSYFLEWDFLQWSGKSPLQNSAFPKKVCISIFFILTISSKKIYFVLYLRSRSFDSYFILPYL